MLNCLLLVSMASDYNRDLAWERLRFGAHWTTFRPLLGSRWLRRHIGHCHATYQTQYHASIFFSFLFFIRFNRTLFVLVNALLPKIRSS